MSVGENLASTLKDRFLNSSHSLYVQSYMSAVSGISSFTEGRGRQLKASKGQTSSTCKALYARFNSLSEDNRLTRTFQSRKATRSPHRLPHLQPDQTTRTPSHQARYSRSHGLIAADHAEDSEETPQASKSDAGDFLEAGLVLHKSLL